MLPLKEVQALTGYIRGGVTALACKNAAAVKLGIPRQTLESKIVNLGINKNRFKSA